MGFTAGSGRPTPIEPPKPTPPPMSGGKGAGRVSPIVQSRPMFRPAPPPVRAGGKGAARVQPTQASLDNSYQQFKNETSPPVIRELPEQFKDSVPEPTLGQQLSAPAATQEQAGTITAPPPTPIRGGGKAGPTADRVAPVTPQPMPMTPPPAPMTPPPIPPGLDNPVFRSLGQQQAAQQPQQSITGMNTNTGSTNSMPAPQSAIFKQGGLIGLMRRR